MAHQKWIDSVSGYHCKIVQLGKDHFKAIAASPDGKNELYIERRNKHIARKDIISAIQNKISDQISKKYSEPEKEPKKINKVFEEQEYKVTSTRNLSKIQETKKHRVVPAMHSIKTKKITAYSGLQFPLRGNFYQSHKVIPGRVDFLKEHYNTHDQNAIAVVQEKELYNRSTNAGAVRRVRKKLGYVPREMVQENRFYTEIDDFFGWIDDSHQITLYPKIEENKLGLPQKRERGLKPDQKLAVNLTNEQKKIIAATQKNKFLKVEALAGTGKTTTLKHIALENPDSKILYLAFNRDIANEAKIKFPHNVTVKTSHSLAYGTVGFRYKHRLSDRIRTHEIAYDLGFELPCQDISESTYLDAVNDALEEFLNTGLKEIWPANIEKHIFKSNENLSHLSEDDLEIICLYGCDLANHAFRQLIKLRNNYPITHDVYFKVWQLTMPVLGYDIVLLDESQDANPALLAVIHEQKRARHIYVGDRFQQIYSWRGAINAMTLLEGEVLYLTHSFRFGQEIADLANIVLNKLGSSVSLMGTKHESTVSDHPINDFDAYIFRTNYGLIKELLNSPRKIRVAGGTKELIETIQMVASIANNSRCREVYGFETWQDFVEYSKKEKGSKYQFAVRIVEQGETNYSLSKLMKAGADTDTDRFDCVYTTVHKAKGKEWNKVKIGGDFRDSNDPSWTEEEDRLLYVAITRAIYKLDITECFHILQHDSL